MKNRYHNGYAGAKVLPMPPKRHLKSAIAPPGQFLWLFRTLLLCLALTGHLQAQDNVTVDTPITQSTTVNAKDTLFATSTVAPPAEAIFRAGESVFLRDGFHAGSLTASGRSLLAQSGITFTASQAISDAYIDLEWEMLTSYMDLPDNGILYIQVLDQATGEEIYTQESYVHHVRENGKLEGSFRHYVGHEAQIAYELNVLLEGDGRPVTTTLASNGTTDTYRQPTVSVSQGSFPDRVEISIENRSDLIGEYRIFRLLDEDTALVASLNMTETAYQDTYSFISGNSLVNGQAYTYRIEPYSNLFERFYTITEHPGSTYAIGVQATDNAFADKVDITWNDVSAFADEIKITRNGEHFVKLPATSTAFTDIRPVFGQVHQYGVILVKNGNNTVAAYDEGGINPNGVISGRITSVEGHYATAGATVTAITEVNGETLTETAVSDATGFYELTGLHYGESANYTLTASLEGHTFPDSPRELVLNRENPTFSNMDFQDEYHYENGNDPSFTFSNLTVTPELKKDYIQLGWTYAPEGPVKFKIFRKETGGTDSTLIGLLTDNGSTLTSYKDLGGLPETDYTYTVQAYTQQGNTISEHSLSGSARYPALAPVGDYTFLGIPMSWLDIAPPSTDAFLRLGWRAHTSENFTGFKVYRDGALIATLSSSALAYYDKKGRPGTEHTYTITAYALKEGQEYESAHRTFPMEVYPLLHPVTDVAANLLPDKVQLTWIPTTKTLFRNFDGANIYRNGTLIGTVHKGVEAKFDDLTGIPGTNYTYDFRNFKYNENTDDESEPVSITVLYPNVTMPTNLVASDDAHTGYIALQWQHTSENHDGFVILRDTDTVAVVPLETTVYKDAVPGSAVSTTYTYTIKAFRELAGTKYYSAAATDHGSAQASGSTEVISPANFTASNDLSGHVLLQWEYPEYILSTFNIYRDGTLLTTLPTDNRVYYDYTAEPNRIYMYQIQANYNGMSSYRVGDPGSLGSANALSGMVTTTSSGRGVVGVNIKAVATIDGNQYIRTVVTDSSGHYRIENLPNRADIAVSVSASLQNHTFAQAQQTVTIQDGTDTYTASFKSSFIDNILISDSVASPIDIVATPDPIGQSVGIRWNVDGANYSGFKVYRGLVEIADISAQHHRAIIDSTGFPGQDYAYRVQAYWDEPYGLQESGFVTAVANYPVVPAVAHLKLVQLEQEDKVQVTWSHPTDKHDYYTISRNDEPIGVVPTGQTLQFMDTTGIPGQVYKYTVMAIKNTARGLFASVPVSAQLDYPLISQIENLTAEQPAGQHHLALSWQHLSENFEGYHVYRNGLVIDTLDRQADGKSTIDRDGAPGHHAVYEVTTFTTKEGIQYESVPVKLDTAYPALLVPTDLTANADTVAGTVSLAWNYAADDMEGYHIYRNDELIATVSGKASTSFTDVSGIPGTNYDYVVKAFDIRGGQQHESVGATAEVTYPGVPIPTGVTASDGTYLNHIEVTWEYQATNNDGFYIYRYGKKVGTVDSGKRNFRQIFDKTGKSYGRYTLKAFRQIGNTIYESGLSNEDAGSTDNNTAPASLTQVTASRGEHLNKVSLEWEYTGGSADVEIYRDESTIWPQFPAAKARFIRTIPMACQVKPYVYTVSGFGRQPVPGSRRL